MTREEKIKGLYSLKEYLVENPIELEGHKSLPITLIDYAIEALEQEPRKGHWIPTYGNVKCSVCGRVKDSRDVGKATHYCSKCGAKMDEPQKSEET
jgi:hypothetical protein